MPVALTGIRWVGNKSSRTESGRGYHMVNVKTNKRVQKRHPSAKAARKEFGARQEDYDRTYNSVAIKQAEKDAESRYQATKIAQRQRRAIVRRGKKGRKAA